METELINEVFGDNVVSFFPIVKSGKNIVTALEKGEAKYYQIHDPLLYKAVAELSPQQLTGFLKLSQSILAPVKLLITQNNPIFAGTNTIRDIQTAYKNSDINNPAKFSVNYLKSAYEVISNSEDYKLYKAIGGGHSSELSATRDLLKKVLQETNLKDSGKARQLFPAITHPVDTTYQVIADFRRYVSVADSIADHSAYLLGAMNGSKLRFAGLTDTTNYREQITIIKNGGYATDVTYVDKVCKAIQQFSLDKYDNQIKGDGNMQGTKSVKITYDDIKLTLDGKTMVLEDLEGRAIEPFLMDGTMYVPISPLVRQFDKSSTYDSKSKTLVIK